MSPSRVRAAVGIVALLALLVAGSVEYGRDRGPVASERILAERQAGKTWYFTVEGGGEFSVRPIVGLLHGYPRVGDATEVRRRADGPVWNAVTARYPFTVLFGLVAFMTGLALAVAPRPGYPAA